MSEMRFPLDTGVVADVLEDVGECVGWLSLLVGAVGRDGAVLFPCAYGAWADGDAAGFEDAGALGGCAGAAVFVVEEFVVVEVADGVGLPGAVAVRAGGCVVSWVAA